MSLISLVHNTICAIVFQIHTQNLKKNKQKQNIPKQTFKNRKTPVQYITGIFHFTRTETWFVHCNLDA